MNMKLPAIAPAGGVILIFEIVSVTVDPLLMVWRIGLPGIPRKLLLPTDAPLQEGAATAVKPVAALELVLSVKLNTEPSESVKLIACPPPRAAASL